MRRQNIDFLELMNFFLDAIYKDAKESSNAVIFDYDPSYPRRYDIDATNTIKAIENLTKIFLYSQTKAKILIGFKLVNYSSSQIHFNVTIRCDKTPSQTDERLLNKAKECALAAEASIEIPKGNEFLLQIKATLAGNFRGKNSLELQNEVIKKYSAVIAYENEAGFHILSNQLKFVGINVRSTSDYQSLKRHVTDAIFKPDIVFISKAFLNDEAEFEELLKFKKLKNFCIVAICEDDENFDKNAGEVIILRQPYTYDVLRAVLDMCYAVKLGAKRR
ncbi:hypothetical protein [Campylobacter curvus]|uniref:hypothetical protein n=1 Tax=Campylobacter curvus TaxID=200 RepID=UPI00035F96B4|nr:hypothetical protein [Campylobacter curvus]QKF61016.1 hypothetical protein CCVT_0710 [Campylobacter curvus]UEB49333.1 hypothetical protein LK426_06810 [Campylobacter curvus]